MNSSRFATTDGVSMLWPEINDHFLSLRGIPDQLQPLNRTQAVYRQLLVGFDAITSCELKDLYKFTLCMKQLDKKEIQRPELCLLVAALQGWVCFDYATARRHFREHLQLYPTDVVALFVTHMFDFCISRTPDLMTDLALFDNYMQPEHQLYSYYLGIKTFVYVEANKLQPALSLGMESLRHCANNIYGIHAVAHALHEQECWQELCIFLEQCKTQWIDNAGMRMHVYWHLAIAYEKSGRSDLSLQTFHEMYALKDSLFAKQDLDAVAFLWRYRLRYPDDRRFDADWQKLAVLWSGSIGSSISYFHRLHAALAFAASNQPFLISKLIAESDGFGLDEETHRIGIAIRHAILDFANDRYAECLSKLKELQHTWDVLGGSRTQRELLPLTMQACEQHCSHALLREAHTHA